MTTLPTVLISGASEELTARIEQLIRGQAELSLVESVTPRAAANRDFKAKLVWVELESDPEANVALLESLIKAHPNTFFVVSKEDLEPELVKRAMQVGALDFLDHKGWAAQIRSVVRRIMAKEFGSKPTQGAGGLSRQPSRQSSWGQLNSVKVAPNAGGFKRAEPNRLAAAQSPPPQPAQKPAAAAPIPVAKPTPAPPPAVEPEVAEEVEIVEQPYEEPTPPELDETPAEESESGYEPAGESTEYGVPEGEYQQQEYESEESEQTGELEEYPEVSGDEAYTQGEDDFAQDSEISAGGENTDAPEYQGETGGASGDEDYPVEDGDAVQAQHVEEPVFEDQSFEDPQSQPGEFESEFEQQLEFESESESESEPEPEPEPELETETEPEPEPIAEKSVKIETPQAVKPKARWDDLDSLISKEAPKAAAEKKPASKWGELGSIQPKISKEPTPSSDKKWSDLDAIVAPKSPASAESPTGSTSKWGDLDSISAIKSEESEDNKKVESSPASSKWGDLDSIGKANSESEPEPPEAVESSWGDLDSIGAPPKAFGKTETGPSSSKWGDLNSIGAKKEEPVEPGSKWGNLDTIGSRGGGGLKSNARSFIKPKTPDESPTRTNSGLGAFADLGLAPGQADAGSASGGTSEPSTGQSKWGDLGGIGSGGPGGSASSSSGSESPSSGLAGNAGLGAGTGLGGGTGLGTSTGLGGGTGLGAGSAGGLGKPVGGDVDSNPSAFKNRFGRKTQNIDLATSNPQDALTGSSGSSAGGGGVPQAGGPGKWGNLDAIGTAGGGSAGGSPAAGSAEWGDLNSIPTPKSAQEASGGNWGSLDSIPTPKGPGESGPTLVEGALPKSRARNEASEKWKSGMGAELSEGQRELGELADKLKEKAAVRVKVSGGWKQASIALAVAIVATVGYLSVAFFSVPEPPTEVETTN